jgi:hypothetical protein
MAVFATSAPALQGTVAVTSAAAAQIFNTVGTPIASPAAATTFPTGVNLGSITVLNTGANTVWVGTSSVTGTAGVPLLAGEELTISNGVHKSAESGTASWNLYAIAASGKPSTVEVALTTFPSIV